MAAKAALLRLFAEEHPYPVVKKADTDIISADKVLDIEIERLNKKFGVLFFRHVKFAFAFISERPQTRYELKILKAAKGSENNKNVELTALCAERCEKGQ